MTIEEAEYILTEAVIEHPSINSYMYISPEEINIAINKILEEKLKNENKIKELENQIIEEKDKLEKLILEYKFKDTKYPINISKNKNKYIRNVIKYIKKMVKPLFLLEK